MKTCTWTLEFPRSDLTGLMKACILPSYSMEYIIQILAGLCSYRYNHGSSAVDAGWYHTYKLMVADDSELGNGVSHHEANTILSTLNSDESRELISFFLNRWNNTVNAWNDGTLNEIAGSGHVINFEQLQTKLEQYVMDTEQAINKGFSSIFEEYNNAVNAYNTADQVELLV